MGAFPVFHHVGQDFFGPMSAGAPGQVLARSVDPNSTEWATISIPAPVSPGGANTNVQYNDGGVFGGDANFTWNKTASTLTITHAAQPIIDLKAATNTFSLMQTLSGIAVIINRATNGMLRFGAGNHTVAELTSGGVFTLGNPPPTAGGQLHQSVTFGTTVGYRIDLAAAATANAIEVRNSSSTILFRVDAAGAIQTSGISGIDGSGLNSPGGHLSYNAGRSTGSAVGGDHIFYTTPAGTSGSGLNTLVERMRISSTANILMNLAAAQTAPAINIFNSVAATMFRVDANGSVAIATALTVGTTIGAAGNITSGGHFLAGAISAFYWSNRSVIKSPSNGIISLTNFAENDFDRLQFGSTTAAYPAIKRSGTSLQIKLADDSALTGLEVGAFKLGTSTTAGYVLTADASGNGSWAAPTGGGGSPSLPLNSVQFNNAGALGGDADFTWNSTTNLLSVVGKVTATTIGTGAATDGGTGATIFSTPGFYTPGFMWAATGFYFTSNLWVLPGGLANSIKVPGRFQLSSGGGYIETLVAGSGIRIETSTGVAGICEASSFNGINGSGIDGAGTSAIVAGGKATGNAAGGSILFQTSDVLTSGSTVQNLTTKLTLTAVGNLVTLGILKFGGETTSFPALQRSGTVLHCVLADASTWANFQAANVLAGTASWASPVSYVLRTDTGHATIGLARAAAQFLSGTAAGDLCIGPKTGKSILFGDVTDGTTEYCRMTSTGLQVNGLKMTTGAAAGHVLTSDATGVGTWAGNKVTFGITIGDGSTAITTGFKKFGYAPCAMRITGWYLLADVAGDIVIDVWKTAFGAAFPTVANTITGTEKPTLTAQQENRDIALGTWTGTTVAEGDKFGYNVVSVATVKAVQLVIIGEKL